MFWDQYEVWSISGQDILALGEWFSLCFTPIRPFNSDCAAKDVGLLI